jgi:hypothetical protein
LSIQPISCVAVTVDPRSKALTLSSGFVGAETP